MSALMKISGLHKTFDARKGLPETKVLAGIDMDLAEGSFTCIVGPTGCGKTTLLRILAGLEKPSSGRVELAGEEVTGPGARIGLVFQEYALFPWRSVLGNVTFGLELSGMGKKERLERAGHYLAMVGMCGFENRYPKELSGGMKQRVAIARTLAVKPKVLLLDEPFASLDAQTRNLMQEFILELWARTGTTVIFVTHNVDEAVFLGTKVVGFSARPARIRETYPVSLELPRNRTGEPFNHIRRKILAYLSAEMG